MARDAASQILASEESVWTISEIYLDRMLVCPWCPRCELIAPATAKRAFRRSVDILAEKVSRYNEWGADPEVAEVRRKASRKKWRENNRDKIRDRSEDKRISERIKLLKEEMEVQHAEEEDGRTTGQAPGEDQAGS
jgi:hypothetical protein